MDMQSFYFFAHLAGKLAFAVSEILHTKMNTKKDSWSSGIFQILPAVGLEPTRCCHQQILSLPRLPIPTCRREQILY